MTFSMVWVIASEKKLRYFEEEKILSNDHLDVVEGYVQKSLTKYISWKKIIWIQCESDIYEEKNAKLILEKYHLDGVKSHREEEKAVEMGEEGSLCLKEGVVVGDKASANL